MVRTFVAIHTFLAAHRRWTATALLLLVAVMLLLAWHVDYEEDIARFLPQGEEQSDYHQAVGQLNSQNRIVIIFTGETAAVKGAMDAFEQHFADVDTARTVGDVQVTVDETRLLDMLAFVSRHAPYFLTPADYARMDSLLQQPGFVAAQLTADKQQLLLPGGGMTGPLLAYDPLHLFAPVMGRLQQLGQNSRFTVSDGYVFTADGRHGLAFLTSPYGVSESARNAALGTLIDQAIALTAADSPGVEVTAVGAPLIAVGNAAQIKHDALLAIAIAVVLILAVLVWHYRRWQDLWWIAASLLFGWLFALAALSLVRDSISLIVLGIGSVIIGIAVNYPLHYLDHLRETGDTAATLRDMVQPLLIGNVTTVSAFLCLLWVDAAAMRDLGLFGSFMLVGTILFVLVVLPLWACPGPRLPSPATPSSDHGRCRLPRRATVGVLAAVTLVLGWYSLQTSFDSDLRHINYMTDRQRADLELLSGLQEELPAEMAAMIPGPSVQQQRLQLWDDFCRRHTDLTAALRQEAQLQGFKAGAFAPFEQLLTGGLQVQAPPFFAPVSECLGMQHLINARNVGAQLVDILQANFNYVTTVCGFVVFFFLWLSFGSIELALLSFLPLAVSWLWILGLMHLVGIQFNIVNIILATFIFGQGDDYTIFMTEGLIYEYATGRRRLAAYRRSIMLSAVLMFIGIGTLIVARHPALHSLAQVTIVGMCTVVLMAYLLPPLVFRWLVRGTPVAATLPGDVSRPLPITLGRVLRSLMAMGAFLLFMYLVLLPLTWLYFHLGRDSEARRLSYHRLLQRLAAFAVRRVPGVAFHLQNTVGETFQRPAVVVCNHQSHLDLLCLMMLTPRIVFLTNDWVWHNPFYGMVVHRAEYYPVSNGIENHVEQLRRLYERGYSICVFPEGTRSADCSILRFHQGAFFLARQLGADVVPVCLHGAGHVLPKGDFLLRRGRIDVEVGRRLTVDGQLLAFTRQMRQYYRERYAGMCRRIETTDYWHPYEQYVRTYSCHYEA